MKKRHTETPPASDEAILDLFAARDERALAEIDRKYRSLLLGVARHILPDERDREECLNDTYLRAWGAIPPAHPDSLRAYLVQIMRRLSLDRYDQNRRARRVPAAMTVPIDDLAELLPLADGGVDETLQAETLRRLVNDFLRTQSERRRFIFIEHIYLCTPVTAVARTLGITESAVYKELTRARVALKEYLAKNGVYV